VLGGAVGAGTAYGLVWYNDEFPHSMPQGLQTAAIVLESGWRYAVAFRYILPIIADWMYRINVVDRMSGQNVFRDGWAAYEEINQRTAKRLLALVRAQGGVYVKVRRIGGWDFCFVLFCFGYFG